MMTWSEGGSPRGWCAARTPGRRAVRRSGYGVRRVTSGTVVLLVAGLVTSTLALAPSVVAPTTASAFQSGGVPPAEFAATAAEAPLVCSGTSLSVNSNVVGAHLGYAKVTVPAWESVSITVDVAASGPVISGGGWGWNVDVLDADSGFLAGTYHQSYTGTTGRETVTGVFQNTIAVGGADEPRDVLIAPYIGTSTSQGHPLVADITVDVTATPPSPACVPDGVAPQDHGECGADGAGAVEGNGAAADPVSTQSGVFTDRWVDLSHGSTRSRVGLDLVRHYSSGYEVEGPFGPGWSTLWASKIVYNDGVAGYDTLHSGDCGSVTFRRRDLVWHGPGWTTSSLADNPQVPGFPEVVRADGTRLRFEGYDLDHPNQSTVGRLLEVVDANGYVTAVSYAPTTGANAQCDGVAGGVARFCEVIEDSRAGGRRLRFEWGPNGDGDRVTRVTDDAGRSVVYEYTPTGQLKKVTGLDGEKWGYEYTSTSSADISRVRDPRRMAVGESNSAGDIVNTYDNQRRVTRQVDNRVSPARVTDIDYTTLAAQGGVIVTDPKGNKRVDYYAFGKRTKVVYGYQTPSEFSVRMTYDQRLLTLDTVVLDGTAGLNRTVLDIDRDAAGRVVEVKRPNGAGGAGSTKFGSFTPEDLPQTVTDPTGIVTTLKWWKDDSGASGWNLKEQCTPRVTPTGSPISCTNVAAADQARTTYTLSSAFPGQVDKVNDARTSSNEWALSYDTKGYLTDVVDPMSNKWSMAYDLVGRPTSSTLPKGNATASPTTDYVTSYEADGHGRITLAREPGGAETRWRYDPSGNLEWVQVPGADCAAGQRCTRYSYTGADELWKATRADGSFIENAYYPDGSLQWQKDADAKITSFIYDPLGRLSSVQDPVNPPTQYTYDSAGQLDTKTDPGGSCATSTLCTRYDWYPQGQLKSVDYSGPTPDVTNIVYDAVGRRTSMAASNVTTSYGWNSLGQLISSSENGQTVSYGWDLIGNLTQLTYPGSKIVNYSVDAAGRVTGVTDWTGAGTIAYTPDANGQYEKITFPGTTTTRNEDTFAFDQAGRLDLATFRRGTTPLGSVDYDRKAWGAVSKETRTGLPGAPAEFYEYDQLDRLCVVATSATTGCSNPTITYDAAGNISKTADGTYLAYDPAHQLCYSGTTAGSCSTPPSNPVDYEYDSRGNRVARSVSSGGQPITYGFDGANRLVTADGGQTGSNGQYTALGTAKRVLQTTTGAVVASGQTKTIDVKVDTAGHQTGIPSAGVAAVVVNVTATQATGAGFLKVYAADDAAPVTSALNFSAAENISNLAIVQVSPSQQIKVTVGGSGNPSTHVIVDVVGWYASSTGTTGGSFTPVTPVRAIDTRDGGGSPKTAGSTTEVQVAGITGVPSNQPTPAVAAVAVNLTAVTPSAAGWLKAWGSGSTAPSTSVLNHQPGETIAAFAIVAVGADGKIRVRNEVSTHFIVDVVGWWSVGTNPTGDTFTPADPKRVLDTRGPAPIGDCIGGCGRLVAGTEKSVAVLGQQGVPGAGVSAVSVNVTVVSPSAGGDLRVIPSDATSYTASSVVNYQAGQTIANAAIVRPGPDGRIKVKSYGADVDVIVDVNGWFSNGTWSYTYNGGGSRLSKTAPDGTTTSFVWAYAGPGQPLMESTGSAITYYIYGPDGLPAKQINPTGPAYHLHHDGTGSTRVVTSAADGTVLATATYKPFGGTAAVTDTGGVFAKVNHEYGGGYTDTETGFIVTGGRPYDPTTSQHTTESVLGPITGGAGYTTTVVPLAGGPLNAMTPGGFGSSAGPTGWSSPNSPVSRPAAGSDPWVTAAQNFSNAATVAGWIGIGAFVLGAIASSPMLLSVASAAGIVALFMFAGQAMSGLMIKDADLRNYHIAVGSIGAVLAALSFGLGGALNALWKASYSGSASATRQLWTDAVMSLLENVFGSFSQLIPMPDDC